MGGGRFQNMTIIDFSGSKFLTKIPDLSRSPNLKEVISATIKSMAIQYKRLTRVKVDRLDWKHNIVVDVENFVPKGLLFQGYTTGHDFVDQDSAFSVIFPGSTIPNWLHHCEEDSDDNSFEIDISALTNLDEISGIALYIVIGSIFGIHVENDGQPGIHMQYGSKYLEDYDIFEMTG
ncbi:hypothetical protein CJ030_MR4G020428 [Morella rubra]|uniref:Uncharacterized protein n=1 Tax=Morella rubra TaxID=262757 RepID=A0A6A1VRZ9_9ROSI|nr:hypothetical protein CJ030_MR4G020428 [Morella rubra]